MPAKLPPVIVLHKDVKNPVLVEAIRVFNGIVSKGEVDLFPADLIPQFVYDHLVAHMAAEVDWRKAAKGEKVAVDVKAGSAVAGRPFYAKLLKLINSALPIGTPGRNDYFPGGNAEHTEAELLAAAVAGFGKHALPKLPGGWSQAAAEKLSADFTAAEAARTGTGVRRKGLSKVAQNQLRQTRSIRTRLRGMVEGTHDEFSPVMLDYGIPVKGPRKPRRKSGEPKAATPVPPNGKATDDSVVTE